MKEIIVGTRRQNIVTTDAPQKKTRIKRSSLLSNLIKVIREDIHNLISPNKIIDEKWEEYQRFSELAKRK